MISSSRKIRRVSDNLKLGKLIVWLWISCIMVTTVSSQDNFYMNGRFGKRKDTVSLSFQPGSRFGRSDGSIGKAGKDAPKLFEIVPRMDRFFYGSRYGKRSSPTVSMDRHTPEIHPTSLNLRRFEAAIDYLDRMRQAAVRQDLNTEGGSDYENGRLDDTRQDEESPYQLLCDGCSKI